MAKKTENSKSGLGMAHNNHFTHQKIQFTIYGNYLKKFKDINILAETKLSDDKPIICPDISIWENVHMHKDIDPENPLVTIEITYTKKNDNYSEDVILDAFSRYPSIHESFIYNFETDVWTRYRRENGEVVKEEEQDYSQVLRCWLHTLLK